MRNIIAMIFVALVSTTLVAQPWNRWRGSGGWGPGGRFDRIYDANTVQTFAGTVISVDRFTAGPGISAGIHLVLQTPQKTLRVILGPEWYIARLDTKLQKGDSIEVKGSLVTIDGKDALLASNIKKGDLTLVLRDANGFPLWAGWRAGR